MRKAGKFSPRSALQMGVQPWAVIGLSCLGLAGCIPVGVLLAQMGAASFIGVQGSQQHQPETRPVTVEYRSELVNQQAPTFPPIRMLVLRPVDVRTNKPVPKDPEVVLPAAESAGEIIGFYGLSSQEGEVKIAPRDEVPDLGVLRRMDSGMDHNPDMPNTIFTLRGLPEIVQVALATHFREAGFHVDTAPFSDLKPLDADHVTYALGCQITEFSLFSLRRYQQIRVHALAGSYLRDLPVRGPTRAVVSLALALYQMPSGELVWQENVWDIVHDPRQGESVHRFDTAEETLTVALSRTVGTVLSTPSLQAVLLHSSPAA